MARQQCWKRGCVSTALQCAIVIDTNGDISCKRTTNNEANWTDISSLLIIDACADPPGKLRSLTLIHQTFMSLSLASPNQIPHTVLFGRTKFSPHMQQMECGSNTTKHKRKKCIATAFRWIIVRVLSVFEVG